MTLTCLLSGSGGMPLVSSFGASQVEPFFPLLNRLAVFRLGFWFGVGAFGGGRREAWTVVRVETFRVP